MEHPNSALITGLHSRGYLPHLKGQNRSYFVTFRLAGTLPRQKLLELKAQREAIVRKAEASRRPLTRAEAQELFRWYSSRVDSYLDKSAINSLLRDSRIATLVRDALLFFNGERYELRAWVIMPNHLHVVIFPTGASLSKILHSWKSYTATAANKILGARGKRFWQPESFDHLIRDQEDLIHCIRYTHNNPVAAGLCALPTEYPWSSAYEPKEL